MSYVIERITDGEILAVFGTLATLDLWVRSQDPGVLNDPNYRLIDTEHLTRQRQGDNIVVTGNRLITKAEPEAAPRGGDSPTLSVGAEILDAPWLF